MNRFDDINNAIKKATPDVQLLLNEAVLGRFLAEHGGPGVRAKVQMVTVPVNYNGEIIFRAAVFGKDSPNERDILVEVAQGNTSSDKCLVIDGNSPILEVFRTKAKVKDSDDE